MSVRPVGIGYSQEGYSSEALVRINVKAGASSSMALTDVGALVELNHTAALSFTVPNDSTVAFPTNSRIDIIQTGAGQVTVVAAAGVVINSAIGLKLRTQWSAATLIKRSANTWVLIGDLSA